MQLANSVPAQSHRDSRMNRRAGSANGASFATRRTALVRRICHVEGVVVAGGPEGSRVRVLTIGNISYRFTRSGGRDSVAFASSSRLAVVAFTVRCRDGAPSRWRPPAA